MRFSKKNNRWCGIKKNELLVPQPRLFFGKSHPICDLWKFILKFKILDFEILNSYICIFRNLKFSQRFMKSQKIKNVVKNSKICIFQVFGNSWVFRDIFPWMVYFQIFPFFRSWSFFSIFVDKILIFLNSYIIPFRNFFFWIFWIFCGNPSNRWKNLLVHSADQEKLRTFPPVANGRPSGARIFWRKCWRLSKN